MGILRNEINVQQRLADILNVELYPCKEDFSLTMIRLHVLQLFYSQNGLMTSEKFYDAMKRYPQVKHIPYRTIKETTKLFVDESWIPKDRFVDFFRVLKPDPDNVREVLSLKPIGGMDIKDIIRTTPYLLSTPYKSIQNILTLLKNFGFPEETIKKCFSVLTLNPRTVRDRLNGINSRKEFMTMKYHPNILKLICYQIKANTRLSQFHLVDKKCISLSVLTGREANFLRYISNDGDKYDWRTCVLFLSKTFNEDRNDVKREISKHPYWLYIPISDMKQTIDTLMHAKFELQDIYSNIHIILYSGELILNRINKLNETQQINGSDPKSLQLKLVLYQIEAEFHFTGDGVWEDREINVSLD